MSSPAKPEPLDLERGLPVTREDVAALRRARALTSLTWPQYEAFLAAQPAASYDELRARPLLSGEPFRLRD
jgi:hypothetical protein